MNILSVFRLKRDECQLTKVDMGNPSLVFKSLTGHKPNRKNIGGKDAQCVGSHKE